MSLNVVLPGKGIPFLHRHQQNDELYIVLGGRADNVIQGGTLDGQRVEGKPTWG
jgi:mannose-6-phosphate isomerase-like protein (cupin superfamily)